MERYEELDLMIDSVNYKVASSFDAVKYQKSSFFTDGKDSGKANLFFKNVDLLRELIAERKKEYEESAERKMKNYRNI